MDKTTSYFLRVFEDAKHYSDERERRLNFIIGAYEDQIRCLQAENDIMTAALKKILQPIKAMQKEAKEQGYQLNGGMAVALAADPNWYQEVAKKALAKKDKV